MSDEIQTAGLATRSGAAVVRIARARAEEPTPVLAEEQLAYARMLDVGMKLGLLLITATFAIYVLGVLTPHVPVRDLPKYWGLPVKQYLAATGIHAGWGWLGMLGKGDILNFVGIAFLSGVTLVCYAAIAPIFVRKNDLVYASLSAVEILVLALAASGVIGAGGH